MNRIDADTAHRIWNAWIERASHKAEMLNPCDLIRMIEDEMEIEAAARISVYHLYLTPGTVPGKLWIGDWDNGEGGAFSKDKFYKVLRKFYKENFEREAQEFGNNSKLNND